MQPVRVTIDVPQSRDAVYEFLDVLANHERFTDHMMKDWRCEGPPSGVGAKARVKTVAAGRTDTVEMEVVEADPPAKTVERNVSAGGRRVGTGTYLLTDLPDGGTRVTFEYAWQKAPWNERLAAPLVRAMVRRANTRAMQRLVTEFQKSTA